jgi:hypothetical protein
MYVYIHTYNGVKREQLTSVYIYLPIDNLSYLSTYLPTYLPIYPQAATDRKKDREKIHTYLSVVGGYTYLPTYIHTGVGRQGEELNQWTTPLCLLVLLLLPHHHHHHHHHLCLALLLQLVVRMRKKLQVGT